MIEREIPKEITDYETKYLFKMTLRQNIAFGIMIIVNLLLQFYAKPFIHNEIVDWLMLLVASLAGAVALWKPNKQDFEKVAWFAIQTELIYPKKRVYRTENIFAKMREDIIAEEKEREKEKADLDKYQERRERIKKRVNNNKLISRFNKKSEKEIEEIQEKEFEEIQGELK